eukprot:scpid53721/ scgid22272/ 
MTEPGRWLLPRPFHGRPEESLAAYLRDYDSCLKTNGYVAPPAEGEADPNRTRLDQMRIFLLQRGLQGPAALVLESLSDEDRDDPVKLRAALVARFGDKGKEAVRQAELQARRRTPGESIPELGDAISILAARAFPGASRDVLGAVATRAFLDALEPTLGNRVADFEPVNIDAAVRKAVVLEARSNASSLELSQGVLNVAAPASTEIADLKATVADLAAAVHTLTRAEPTRPPRPPACFHCGITGHFKRDCRKFKYEMSQRNSQAYGSSAPQPPHSYSSQGQHLNGPRQR